MTSDETNKKKLPTAGIGCSNCGISQDVLSRKCPRCGKNPWPVEEPVKTPTTNNCQIGNKLVDDPVTSNTQDSQLSDDLNFKYPAGEELKNRGFERVNMPNQQPVASNTGKELKPCPYHGDHKAMEFSGASKAYAACVKCDRGDERWYRPVEDWNNAWAHKLIEALQRQNKTNEEFQDSLLDKIASLESSLEGMKKQISSMEFDRKNMLMFFQVATDALETDPSCEPGKLDPMCVAEAVRGLREQLKTAEDKLAAVTKDRDQMIGSINATVAFIETLKERPL